MKTSLTSERQKVLYAIKLFLLYGTPRINQNEDEIDSVSSDLEYRVHAHSSDLQMFHLVFQLTDTFDVHLELFTEL